MASQLLNFVVKNDQHLGHLLLSSFKNDQEAICQIDAGTGEKETNGSVLSRSIRMARSLRNLGLQPGDVMCISGKNHLDLHIPYFAAIFNGLPICAIDNLFKYDEVKDIFNLVLPKVAFCDEEAYEMFVQVVKDLNFDTTVIKYGTGENSMKDFVEKYDKYNTEDFRVAEFDVEKVYLWLPTTSGSTGPAKVAALKQRQVLTKTKLYLQAIVSITRAPPMSQQRYINLNVGPIHWVSGIFTALSTPLLNNCNVQTSRPFDEDHLIDVIKEYKPISVLTNPAVLSSLLYYKKPCDFSSFKTIVITGSNLRQEVYEDVCSRLSEGSYVINMYGQTESIGPIIVSDPFGPRNAFVMPVPAYETKIVDPDTGTEITEPLKPGELWAKGPLFTEYYRNPEETKKALTNDGWLKTGDIFYKDEAGRFYYVERLKTVIKYRSYHIIPAELEDLIRQHPGVREVVVSSVPHDLDGEHPVACIVKEQGTAVCAKEITHLIADKLSESKQLRGGVIFLDETPLTSSGKVAQRKVKEIVMKSVREL